MPQAGNSTPVLAEEINAAEPLLDYHGVPDDFVG